VPFAWSKIHTKTQKYLLHNKLAQDENFQDFAPVKAQLPQKIYNVSIVQDRTGQQYINKKKNTQ
jgi:hypothetical protein